MSLNLASRNAIADWFASATGLQCAWVAQTMPRLGKPFGTLKMTSGDNPQGTLPAPASELRLDANAPGVQTYVAPLVHALSLQIFSNDTTGETRAEDLMSLARKSLEKQATRDTLYAAGVTVQGASAVRDLTQLLATSGESRAQMDLTLATVESHTEDVGYIAEVDAHLTVAPALDEDLTIGG